MFLIVISSLILVSCGQNPEIKSIRFKKNKLLQYDSSYDAISNPSKQEADCIQGENAYRNTEYWTMDAGYFLCHENQVVELDENCDSGAEKDTSCKTISDLRESGIDIPDIDELASLPILSATRGLIGKLGNMGNVGNVGNKGVGKVAPAPKEPNPPPKKNVPVGQCINGQEKIENLKYGKRYKKCIDLSWKTTNVKCDKDTNQYDYYKNNDTCLRKNVSECRPGQTKSKNIQYGEVKYKCSDYEWKFDKVSCDSDTKSASYKKIGQSCKKENKRMCVTRYGVMSEGDKKSKSISGGKIVTECKNGRTKTELDCNFGYRESGNSSCVK